MFVLTVILDEHEDNHQDWTSLHQCLLMLFDSPLNHSGHLRVLIRVNAEDGSKKVIKMHREVRIPRTFKRFQQLFCNFLQGCDMPLVSTKDGHVRLIEYAGKSLEKSFKSSNDRIIFRVSNLAPNMKSANFFTDSISNLKETIIFIDFGPVDFNILGDDRDTEYETKTITYRNRDEETFSLSRYPLDPSLVCVKLTSAFEEALEVF